MLWTLHRVSAAERGNPRMSMARSPVSLRAEPSQQRHPAGPERDFRGLLVPFLLVTSGRRGWLVLAVFLLAIGLPGRSALLGRWVGVAAVHARLPFQFGEYPVWGVAMPVDLEYRQRPDTLREDRTPHQTRPATSQEQALPILGALHLVSARLPAGHRPIRAGYG
jgi:hypothetical protein